MTDALIPLKIRTLVGLSVAVTASDEHYQPVDRQNGCKVYGSLRLRGWAAALECGFAESLVIVGGCETLSRGAIPDEDAHMFGTGDAGPVAIPRGYANGRYMVDRYNTSEDLLAWSISEGHTGGNAARIDALLEHADDPDSYAISSNWFHLPRAQMDLLSEGVPPVRMIPAEAFLAAKMMRDGLSHGATCHQLSAALGTGSLADRAALEICGIADKITGAYMPGRVL